MASISATKLSSRSRMTHWQGSRAREGKSDGSTQRTGAGQHKVGGGDGQMRGLVRHDQRVHARRIQLKSHNRSRSVGS